MTYHFDIEPVLRHYGAHDIPTGYTWRNVLCPFHEDRQTSAQVNTDTGYFRCFGICDFFGDALDIIQWQEGIGFREAVAFAEGVAGGGHGGSRSEPQPGSFLPGGTRGNRGSRKSGATWRGSGTYSR